MSAPGLAKEHSATSTEAELRDPLRWDHLPDAMRVCILVSEKVHMQELSEMEKNVVRVQRVRVHWTSRQEILVAVRALVARAALKLILDGQQDPGENARRRLGECRGRRVGLCFRMRGCGQRVRGDGGRDGAAAGRYRRSSMVHHQARVGGTRTAEVLGIEQLTQHTRSHSSDEENSESCFRQHVHGRVLYTSACVKGMFVPTTNASAHSAQRRSRCDFVVRFS